MTNIAIGSSREYEERRKRPCANSPRCPNLVTRKSTFCQACRPHRGDGAKSLARAEISRWTSLSQVDGGPDDFGRPIALWLVEEQHTLTTGGDALGVSRQTMARMIGYPHRVFSVRPAACTRLADRLGTVKAHGWDTEAWTEHLLRSRPDGAPEHNSVASLMKGLEGLEKRHRQEDSKINPFRLELMRAVQRMLDTGGDLTWVDVNMIAGVPAGTVEDWIEPEGYTRRPLLYHLPSIGRLLAYPETNANAIEAAMRLGLELLALSDSRGADKGFSWSKWATMSSVGLFILRKLVQPRETPATPIGGVPWLSAQSGVDRAMLYRYLQSGIATPRTQAAIAAALGLAPEEQAELQKRTLGHWDRTELYDKRGPKIKRTKRFNRELQPLGTKAAAEKRTGDATERLQQIWEHKLATAGRRPSQTELEKVWGFKRSAVKRFLESKRSS